MKIVVLRMAGIDFEMVFISLSFSRVTVIRGQVVTTSGRGLVGVRITRYQEYQTILIKEICLHFKKRKSHQKSGREMFIRIYTGKYVMVGENPPTSR